MDLDDVRRALASEHGLATISTTQADGRVLSSIANCGLIDHPLTGDPVLALVSMGTAGRVRHVRRGSELTALMRRGWNWVSVTGPVELIGPDDPVDGLDADAVRVLLRDIFHAAGGTHDDLDAYDRAMTDERRVAMLVRPERIIGNAPAG